VKLSLKNAILILLAGMLLLATGSFLKSSQTHFSNPITLSGLAVEFLGTIWLVLSLNLRRKKH
jgi:hypothetical protein